MRTKLILSAVAALAALATPVMADEHTSQARQVFLPADNVETLCQLRATNTTAAYRQRASAYGLSIRQLRQLETQHVCEDGQRFVDIQSAWRG